MERISLRPAAPGDETPVEDYHHRCFVQSYSAQIEAGDFGPPDRDGTREQLGGWFQPGSEFITTVAVLDGAVIGHFTVKGNNLVHLFVAPDHHGTGLGRYLLAQGEAKLAYAGHLTAELHTRVENVHAIGFYAHCGWSMTDETTHTVEHGISYHEHIMTKRLGTAAPPAAN